MPNGGTTFNFLQAEPDFSCSFCFKPLTITIGGQFFYDILRISMKDIPNGIMPGYVLYLTTAKIILSGQHSSVLFLQDWYHFTPQKDTKKGATAIEAVTPVVSLT